MSIHRVSEGSLHVGGFANSIENHVDRDQPQPDVLLLSQRRIADLAAYCLAYEFEDTFAAVTDAQRIDVTDLPALEFSRRAYKLARLASGSAALARRLAPSSRAKVVLERDFDLFFPVFSHSYELYSLATISQLAPAMPQGGLFYQRSLVGPVTGISARAPICI